MRFRKLLSHLRLSRRRRKSAPPNPVTSPPLPSQIGRLDKADEDGNDLTISYSALKSDDEIRILVLHQGHETDPISCSLEHIRLSERPRFEAISYTWGDEPPTESIRVQGQDVQIRENLFHLLKRFRLKDTDRALWVDALCIHQDDISERNHQVPLMREIYSRSMRTLIWLGEEEDGDDFVIEFFAALSRQFAGLGSDEEESLVVQKILGFDVAERSKLTEFFRKPWFKRMWTVQEFALSDDIEIWCGKSPIPLDALSAVNKAVSAHRRLNYGELYDVSVPFNQALRLRSYVQNPDEGGLSLPDVLVTVTGVYRASDPRDNVYGALGLVTHGSNPPLRPNYALSVAEVYCSAMETIYMHEDPTFLFPLLAVATSRRDEDIYSPLPTWTPHFYADVQYSPWTYLWVFHAAGSDEPSMRFVGQKLYIKGVVIDTIDEVSRVPHDAIFTGEVEQSVQQCYKTLYISPEYPTGEPLSDAWWRILIGDYRTMDPNRALYTSARDGYGEHYLDPDVMAALNGSFSDSDIELRRLQEDYVRNYNQLAMRLDMFRTAKGYYGWGPETTIIGDKICLFAGSQSPFVIRPQANGDYLLIGDTFIHGIMYGEALEGNEPQWDELVLA